MFQVIIKQLEDSCHQMEQQSRKLFDEMDALKGTIAMLSSLSGMEGMVSLLHNSLSEMEEEELILERMLQVLNRILSSYVECERRILTRGERRAYSVVTMGMIEFPQKTTLLS